MSDEYEPENEFEYSEIPKNYGEIDKSGKKKFYKSITNWSLFFSLIIFLTTLYFCLFFSFFNEVLPYALYIACSFLIAVGTFFMFAITKSHTPHLKKSLVISIGLFVFCILQFFLFFAASRTTGGCDSMVLMLMFPFEFLIGIICLVYLGESIFLMLDIKFARDDAKNADK